MKTLKIRHAAKKGFSSLLAMLFVMLFSVLAVSFAAITDTNLQMSKNHRNVAVAQAAAESGLTYMGYLVSDYIDNAAPKTFNNTINDDEAYVAFEAYTSYLQFKLADVADRSIPAITSFVDQDDQTGNELTGKELNVPPIAYCPDRQARFAYRIRQYDDDLHTFEIVSIGTMGNVSRSVRLNYGIKKDTSILNFSVASRSRVILTGDSTVKLGIYSDWEHTNIAPPVDLSAESTIDGDLNVTIDQGDYEFPDDVIAGTVTGDINYDQPKIDLPTADDFDTSAYTDMTKTLPNSGLRVTEYFPHAEGDYTRPVWGSVLLKRTVYGPKKPGDPPLVIKDRILNSGANALFKNCIFEGILYIGNGGGLGTNNIRFENCVFNGAIVTGVPPKFGPETWKKNVLYFTGDSQFNNQTTVETTILAPNYNVNIGDTKALQDGSESVLTGIVLGGVVDIRGNARVDGTIVSMCYPDPDDWGWSAGQVATNIGFSNENNEAGGNPDGIITITPDPDGKLPPGMSSKVLMFCDGGSYDEWNL